MTARATVHQRIVEKLRDRVVDDAVGAREPTFRRYDGHAPNSRFWLGKLVPESRVFSGQMSRAAMERFQPASQGFTFRTAHLPVELTLEVSFSIWLTLHPTVEEQRRGVGLEADEIRSSQTEEHPSAGSGAEHPNANNTSSSRGEAPGIRHSAAVGLPLARVRTKVPIGPVSITISLDSPGERTAGAATIQEAIQSSLANVPQSFRAYRPLRRGGALPREGDVTTSQSWNAYSSVNLSDVAIPAWKVEIDLDIAEQGPNLFEISVLLTNRSPDEGEQFVDRDRTQRFPAKVADPTIYEARLSCAPSTAILPYELEQIPDSYRYDRTVAALGMNSAVEVDRG